ncbi:hypothetical protein MPSEU_000704200 [Mayamaea pseudoterrestris]|nr:hypothetical protein MPSEU_000704200 [Mayamaea pseudoterrestris]
MSHAVSGMAASIRNTTESETFDLAGQAPQTIENTIRDAFSDPFDLETMIRITFIVGAGKLGRQKYDESAAKVVTSTLRECDFEEDRGASAVMECAGSFKLQHDTGKNLKTVVVFPKVNASNNQLGKDMAKMSLGAALIPEGSHEYKLAYSSINVFEKNIASTCPSWSQKKGCAKAIEGIVDIVKGLDTKLMQGTPLSEAEDELYNSVSLKSLEEKLTLVRDLMHKHVEDGRVTVEERRSLLDQVDERIQSLKEEIAEAEKEGKKKRVENLAIAKGKAEERKTKLEKTGTSPPHPLKHESDIAKLRREMLPLLAIEEGAKGRLLTLKESQSVARKDEIVIEIEALEESSRGWFETDEGFQARVQASRSAWESQRKQQKSKMSNKPKAPAGGAYKSVATTATKWSTPASRKPVAAKPAAKASGGGVFSAMMMDSDSD